MEGRLVGSLRQFVRMSPVVCCRREESPCLIDVNDSQAKAAMYRLNQMGRRRQVLEEARLRRLRPRKPNRFIQRLETGPGVQTQMD